MEFVRVNNINDVRLNKSLGYYKDSFPLHEQRESASQAAVMSDEEYFFDLIFDGESEVGAVLFWQTDGFIYVEHFYIYPEFRGMSYGSKALAVLAEYGKTVILEIDPPKDDISVSRKAFYERNGFAANSYPHVHPPYHRGSSGHDLVIMSYPNEITQAEYDAFNEYLKCRVMNGVF